MSVPRNHYLKKCSGSRAASYVWDYPKRGSPVAPLGATMKAMGIATPGPPSPHATAMPALEGVWRTAGFGQIRTRTIEIAVEFADFDAFWESITIPVGPAGKAVAAMSPDDRGRLRAALKERTPLAADGRVVYPARANAIEGRKES